MKTYSEIYARVAALDMAEDDGRIWMSLIDRNGICEVDKETGHARIVRTFDGESSDKFPLYCCVEKMGQYLIFGPGLAENIAVYDTLRDSLSYIPLKKMKKNYRQCQKEFKFWSMFQHGADVYLLGYAYPAIVRINMKTMDVAYITDWVEEAEASIEDGDSDGYFSYGHMISGDYALFPMGCMSAALKLDLKTSHTQIIKLKTSMKGIGGLFSPDGNCVWMVGRGSGTNRAACWDRRTGRIKEFVADGVEDIQGPQSQLFYEPVCVGGKMLLLPFSIDCDSVYEVCADTGEIKKSGIMENGLKNTGVGLWPWIRTMALRVEGDRLMFLTCDDFCWHEYHVTTGESRHYYVLLENIRQQEEHFHAGFLNSKELGGLILETRMPLRYFLDEISGMKGYDEYYEEKNKIAVGERIYAQISGK